MFALIVTALLCVGSIAIEFWGHGFREGGNAFMHTLLGLLLGFYLTMKFTKVEWLAVQYEHLCERHVALAQENMKLIHELAHHHAKELGIIDLKEK